ncbi:unnamed protein product [Camellia sinensis]
MEDLFSQFIILSDQSLYDKNFDPSTIEDLMKLFELESYKSWAAMELEHENEVEQAEESMKEAEDELDSAMESAMEEFRLFEEEMEREAKAELQGLVRIGESAWKMGKSMEKAASIASRKYVEAAMNSASASMKSAWKGLSSSNTNKVILLLLRNQLMGRDKDLSRSPSYRRRYSPSPAPVRDRYSRRSRRDRSRSPYSYSRRLFHGIEEAAPSLFLAIRRSRSISPRRRKSPSPTPRRRKSRSPTPRHYKRQTSISNSLSPPSKSHSPSSGSIERKNAIEKLRKEEEEKKRAFLKEDTAIVQLVIFDDELDASFIYCVPVLKLICLDQESVRGRQQEAELNLIEEETTKRVEEAIRNKVKESLNSEEIKLEVQRRLEEGRKKLIDVVAAQLEKEKEVALIGAKQKEEQARKEKEELERMLEENRRKLQEAQMREALEQQRREEERYRELEELQRQKEEAMRRKKQQEEEERTNQTKVLGKNKSRPKVSFALSLK